MVFVTSRSGLKIDDRALAVEIGDEVDEAHERQVEIRDMHLEHFFGRPYVGDPAEFRVDKPFKQSLSGGIELFPALAGAVAEVVVLGLLPSVLKVLDRIAPIAEESSESLVDRKSTRLN